MKSENWVTVYKFFDIFEGQRLEQILKEHDIPAVIFDRTDSAYDGVLTMSTGMGEIKVREDYIEKAKKIIADFKKESKGDSK